MTTFDDRERAFETKYARDEEVAFRIVARRNRLLGQWAATQMKLTKEESDAYATAVVQAYHGGLVPSFCNAAARGFFQQVTAAGR